MNNNLDNLFDISWQQLNDSQENTSLQSICLMKSDKSYYRPINQILYRCQDNHINCQDQRQNTSISSKWPFSQPDIQELSDILSIQSEQSPIQQGTSQSREPPGQSGTQEQKNQHDSEPKSTSNNFTGFLTRTIICIIIKSFIFKKEGQTYVLIVPKDSQQQVALEISQQIDIKLLKKKVESTLKTVKKMKTKQGNKKPLELLLDKYQPNSTNSSVSPDLVQQECKRLFRQAIIKFINGEDDWLQRHIKNRQFAPTHGGDHILLLEKRQTSYRNYLKDFASGLENNGKVSKRISIKNLSS